VSATERGANLADLVSVSNFVRRRELNPLIDRQRAEEPVIACDTAEREPVGFSHHSTHVVSRPIQLLPRGLRVEISRRLHRLTRRAAVRAVPNRAVDGLWERLTRVLLWSEPRGSSLPNGFGHPLGEEAIDLDQMFQHFGHRPAIRRRPRTAKRVWHGRDGRFEDRARLVEARQDFGNVGVHSAMIAGV